MFHHRGHGSRGWIGPIALSLLLLWAVLFICSGWPSALAQQKAEAPSTGKDAAQGGAEPKVTVFPGMAEVVPRAEELARRADEARAQVDARIQAVDFERGIREAEARLKDLAARLGQMGDPRQWDFQRLQDARVPLENERKTLEGYLSPISARLNELEALRREWEERLSFWSEWKKALGTAQPELPADAFAKADETIRGVMQEISRGTSVLVALQERISRLMEENRQLASPIEATLTRMRGETFRRTEPAFLTRGFVEHLRSSPWPALRAGLVAAGRQAQESFRREEAVVILQLILVASLGLVAAWRRSRLRISGQAPEFWSNPLALAVFAVGVISSLFLRETSGPWKVGSRCAFAFAVAVLYGSGHARARWRKLLVGLAASLTGLDVIKTIGLPVGWYRVCLAALAGGGAVGFFLRKAPGGVSGRVIRLGAVILGVVFLSQVSGFANLSDRLFHACAWSVILALSGFLVANMVRNALGWVMARPQVKMRTLVERLGPSLERRIFTVLAAVIWLMALLRLFPVWGIYPSTGDAWEALLRVEVGLGRISLSLGLLLLAALVVYISFLVSWLLNAFLETEVFPRADVDPGARHAVGRLIHYLLVVLGFLLAMSLVGIQLESFLVLGGALGVGIGFGLQHVANNFISGLILLFERPVKVGDTVVVDKEWGRVKRIGLRSTVIETFARSELIVPNSQLVSNTVTNWTLSNPMARLRIPVGVAYGTDVEMALRLLREAAGRNPRVLKDPPPLALFTRFGDSALELELHAWVGDVKERLLTQSEICQEIDRLFRELGIEIPFPQRDVHIRSVTSAQKTSSAYGFGHDGEA